MTLTARERQARAMSEAQLQKTVNQMLETFGYVWHHERPARFANGRIVTHFDGHGGYLDVSAVHPKTGKILKFELKVQLASKGKISDSQQVWLDAYAVTEAATGGILRSGVWRPMDLLDGTIEAILIAGTRRQGDNK